MLCERCGKKQATYYYEQTINGQSRTAHLCPDCAHEAQQKGEWFGIEDAMPSLWDLSQHGLLGGLLGDWSARAGQAGGASERVCPECGMREGRLRREGRAGCPTCYTTFGDVFEAYCKKLHGATRHIGTEPQKQTEQTERDRIEVLRAQLSQALAHEEYEQAARLRDEIRRLEGEQK